MTAPIKLPIVPDPAELIAVVRTLQDAVEVFRTMKERLGLTFEFIDDVSGLTKGHADKVLSRTEQKRLGYDTFALFTKLFAVEFRVHIDMESVKEMEMVWEGRKRPLFPHRKPGRVSKKLIGMAKPHVAREMGRSGGTKTRCLLSARQASDIGRKGGRMRSRKLGSVRRKEIAKKAAEARWRPVQETVE